MRRVIRLLDDPPVLTPKQLAQKKWRQGPKGRAATAREIAKRKADASEKAKKRARADAWEARNALHVRAYHRIYMRRWRREQRDSLQMDSAP